MLKNFLDMDSIIYIEDIILIRKIEYQHNTVTKRTIPKHQEYQFPNPRKDRCLLKKLFGISLTYIITR
jgi:hypothetical protein